MVSGLDCDVQVDEFALVELLKGGGADGVNTQAARLASVLTDRQLFGGELSELSLPWRPSD